MANQLGSDAVVRLFVSRVDGTQRGGDIDLLVEPKLPLEHRIQAARLFIRLGGHKVDVLLKDPTMPSQLIHEQAITHGIIL